MYGLVTEILKLHEYVTPPKAFIEPFKTLWSLYVPPALTYNIVPQPTTLPRAPNGNDNDDNDDDDNG
jgi:hypothetical protein